MSEKKLSQEEFERQAKNLAQVLDRVRDLGFADVARIERVRGAGLVREVARRKARLGAEVPKVRAEAVRVGAQVERNTRVAGVRRTVEIGRDLNPDFRKITGRVLDQRGRPAVGVKVVVSKDDALRRPLGADPTDRSGTYLIEVTRSAFAAYFRGAKEFVVTALDKRGKPLREVRKPVSEKDAPLRVVNLSLGKLKVDRPSRPGRIPLSEIPGLGRARIRKLEDAGITEAAELIKLPPARLAATIGVRKVAAEAILRSAKEKLAAPR